MEKNNHLHPDWSLASLADSFLHSAIKFLNHMYCNNNLYYLYTLYVGGNCYYGFPKRPPSILFFRLTLSLEKQNIFSYYPYHTFSHLPVPFRACAGTLVFSVSAPPDAVRFIFPLPPMPVRWRPKSAPASLQTHGRRYFPLSGCRSDRDARRSLSLGRPY